MSGWLRERGEGGDGQLQSECTRVAAQSTAGQHTAMPLHSPPLHCDAMENERGKKTKGAWKSRADPENQAKPQQYSSNTYYIYCTVPSNVSAMCAIVFVLLNLLLAEINEGKVFTFLDCILRATCAISLIAQQKHFLCLCPLYARS
jgi:hypothetical protein